MAEYASYLYTIRKEYVEKLNRYSKLLMKEISDGKEEIELIYKSDVKEETKERKKAEEEYRKIFTEELEREKIVGISFPSTLLR